jgi:exopolyphosphatase/guanosine-5'-triphosphate,3'-diphosphate pyrophosphatase
MNKRYAILDLGTNTFNLLIAEVKSNHTFEVLVKAEEFIKLAEDGIEKIGERAFLRGMEQLKKYKAIIDQFNVNEVVGFGTAAIRNASNGDQFIAEAKEVCPMVLRKITGDEEAELIYHGVRQAVRLEDRPSLITDIGGGSVEFIIANKEQIFWKHSFSVGGSLLKQKFHHHEPIRAEEVVHLINHIQQELAPLIEKIKPYAVNHLICASGSFDTMAELISENIHHQPLNSHALCTPISLRDFHIVYEKLIRCTLEERLQLKGMVWFRAEMIVVAAILSVYVIEKCGIRKVTRSAYALKEGVLWGMMEGKGSA